MTVDLTFRHDDHRWRIRRTFYTNTMPSTALLANLDTGAKVDNIRPVNEAIVAMLRMEFTHAKYGHDDLILQFESELSRVLGHVAAAAVGRREEPIVSGAASS